MTGFIQAGEQFEAGVKMIGTGDMGIANTTPSAAIGAAITGAALDDMVSIWVCAWASPIAVTV